MCIEQVDARLLNRGGLALRALAEWAKIQPGDDHPTNGQLARRLAEVTGQAVDERTIARGIADLTAAGLIVIERDRTNRVGRRIAPAQAMGTRDRTVTPDSSVAPPPTELSRLTYYVDSKESSSETFNVGRDSSVGGDSSVAPGDPSTLASVLGRLSIAIGAEHQPRLPLTGGGPPPRAKGTELRLVQVLGRLEDPGCDATDVQWAIGRLTGEFGPPHYQPFHRKVCEAVRTGREPIGRLMEAVEEAMRGGAKNRGAAFIAACRRTMPSLRAGDAAGAGGSAAGDGTSRTPDPGSTAKPAPGSGGSVRETSQSTRSVV